MPLLLPFVFSKKKESFKAFSRQHFNFMRKKGHKTEMFMGPGSCPYKHV